MSMRCALFASGLIIVGTVGLPVAFAFAPALTAAALLSGGMMFLYERYGID